MPGAEVWFYHLERTDLVRALGGLLQQCLSKRWRAVVRVPTHEALERLDVALWTFEPASFLPHVSIGQDADAGTERSPIVLTLSDKAPSAGSVLFLVYGAPPQSMAGFQRVCMLFDGRDDQERAAARRSWKALKQAGETCIYWKQTETAWERAG